MTYYHFYSFLQVIVYLSRLPPLSSYAVGIQTFFHWTAFLHISSRSDERVQSLPSSVSSSSFWLDKYRVFRGLVQVCWRYWQPYNSRSEKSNRIVSHTPTNPTKSEHQSWFFILTSALPQYQMALMTLWLARATVSWSLLPVRIFTKPAGRSEDWSTWGRREWGGERCSRGA